MSLRFLNGSAPKPVPEPLLQSASNLYATLHHTGGKVGAANQWRKSVDDTLSFGWGALLKLRTTFNTQSYDQFASRASSSNEDPLISIPLHLDRLRAAAAVLEDLLRSSNPRPVPLPIGSIVRFCQALVSCTRDEKKVLLLGCPTKAKTHLSISWKVMSTLSVMQWNCRHFQRYGPMAAPYFKHFPDENAIRDPVLASRVSRAVLPALTTLLGTQSDAQREDNNSVAHSGTSKKGKKRARGYEGDEVFKIAKEVILPTHESGKAVIVSLEIVRLLMSQGSMTPSVHSLTSRVLLAVYMAIPNIPPGIFSSDPALHGTVYQLVQHICVEAAAGTTSTLSKSLGLVISASLHGQPSSDVMKEFDLQLHPRVPPLIRALPHVEALALFRAEEGQEENNIRHGLRIGTVDELQRSMHMQETILPSQVRTDKQSDAPTVPSVPAIPPTHPMLAKEAPPASSALPQSATPVAATATAPAPIFMESARVSTQPPPPPPPPPPQADPVLSADIQPSSAPISPSVFADHRQTAAASTSTTPSMSTQAAVPTPRHVQMATDDDDDEPMPSIDMGSDSDSE
ncbi:hypothetical protein EIP86_009560 [Pleurotus ostreatoroseus]|nr:hypothetical protein EIP86_009560 [Pleurotus ostreatoroseus]